MLFLGIVLVLEELVKQTDLSNNQKAVINNIVTKIRLHLKEVNSEN